MVRDLFKRAPAICHWFLVAPFGMEDTESLLSEVTHDPKPNQKVGCDYWAKLMFLLNLSKKGA
jgi:hypothetical protein